jgi:DNA-3-methyladenine glycosylase
MKLDPDFYLGKDVIKIARKLLGKWLITSKDGKPAGGIITETEAYCGVVDRASHAFGGRRTARTEIMYGAGGTAYVYLCYGIHSLFNVVTNLEGIPHAVLVRSVYPVLGVDLMKKRRKQPSSPLETLCSGPGKVCQALGIHYSDTGKSLAGKEIWIEDRGLKISPRQIITGPRVGVGYAKEDALLPYRFRIFPDSKMIQKLQDYDFT